MDDPPGHSRLSSSSHRGMAMMALVTTLRRSAWIGLTLYVAFLLTIAAHAAGPVARSSSPPSAPESYVPPAPSRMTADSSPYGPPPSPPPAIGAPTPYGPLPPPAPPFQESIYGAQPNPGVPGSPGYLHPHYPEYQTRYGIWYQPRSFHEPFREPYRPDPFRPRGWGNLFADDCRRVRMDYNRYVVKDLPSHYGPSYYPKYSQAGECLLRPERHYSPPVWGAAE